jgi:hypothetical protein
MLKKPAFSLRISEIINGFSSQIFIKRNNIAFIAILSCLFIILFAGSAYALSFTSPFDGSVFACDIAGQQSITVKVVSCIKMVVIEYTREFLKFISAVMMPIMWVLVTFSLIFTAMRVMLMERNPQKIMIGAIFKIFVVILLTDNFGANSGMFGGAGQGMLEATFSAMEGLQVMVINAMYEDSTTCTLSAHNGQASAIISADGYKPFAYMDCVLEYIMGFNTAAGIGASLLGFTSSVLFSGTMGAAVFFFGIATLLSITFFVLRVVYTVIVCYVYAGLMISIAPILMWTLMFRYTEEMFFKLLNNILGAIFMPFMMVAFMAFAIPLLDSYVLSSTNPRSLVNVLGEATGLAASGNNITDHYRTESPFCSLQMPTDPLFAQGLDQSQIRENDSNPIATGAFDWCAAFKGSSVDLGDEHHNKLWKIAQSLLQILFIVWIITSVGNHIPLLTGRIMGSSGVNALGDSIKNNMALEGWAQSSFRSQAVSAQTSGKNPMIGAGANIASLFKK